MHDSIEQGLRIYREAMAKYREYFDKHGFRVGQPTGILSKPIERGLTVWSARLEGMRKVLGMTREEAAEINKQFGLEINTPSSRERGR